MLQRQQLRPISAAAWRDLLAQDWPAAARPCLAHWAAHDLPLVVTRQPAPPGPEPEAPVCLGLPAPNRWGRQRLRIEVPRAALGPPRDWPTLAALSRHPPTRYAIGPAVADRLGELADALTDTLGARGAPVQVYGSHGWQLITGLDHLRAGSDLDLWLPINGPLGDGLVAQLQADAVVRQLQARSDAAAATSTARARLPRLDGELGFADGAAIAWREWADWRAGRCRQVLVKRLSAVELIDAPVGRLIVPTGPSTSTRTGEQTRALSRDADQPPIRIAPDSAERPPLRHQPLPARAAP